uniref:PH domain-containing protein n=1 Tax=Ornithorhynchus anatinus TaxID=9258 RepID=A0A6I8PHH3_ORNAN
MQGGPFGPDPAPSAPTAFWDLESVRLRPPARASGPQPRKGRGPPGAPGPSSPSSSSSCWDLIMKYRVVSKPRPAAFLRPPEGAPGPGGDGGRPGDAGGAECAGVDRIPSPALGGTEAGSVLRRWKRNWFVLWLDGTLGYSRDEAGQDEEGRVLIRFNCRSVKSGHECPDLQPPEGLSRSCLLTVHLRVGPRLVLCADSEDDAVAWKTALLEASSSLVYNPYDDRYQPVPLDAHHVTFVGAGHYGPYAGRFPPHPSSPATFRGPVTPRPPHRTRAGKLRQAWPSPPVAGQAALPDGGAWTSRPGAGKDRSCPLTPDLRALLPPWLTGGPRCVPFPPSFFPCVPHRVGRPGGGAAG